MSTVSEDGNYYIAKQSYVNAAGELVQYERKNKRKLKVPGGKSKPGKPKSTITKVKESMVGLSDEQMLNVIKYVETLKNPQVNN